MRPLPLALLLLAALPGCREGIAGPDDALPDLSPRLTGSWTGTYDGRLGLLGTDETPEGTYRLDLDVTRVGPEFAYAGEVSRDAPNPAFLYGCGPQPVSVSNDRRVTFECVQGTQLGDTLVLHVEARGDTAFQALDGVVRDVLGVEGAAYEITLSRTAP